MRRIINIARRDFKSNLRDFIAIYIMVAPIILAFIIVGFVPSAESATISLAVDHTIEDNTVRFLEEYIEVEKFNSKDQLVDRINKIDDRIGLTKAGNTYEIIEEGNEKDNVKPVIINLLGRLESNSSMIQNNNLTVEFSNIGTAYSPIAKIGLISIAILSLVLGGMVVSMNIIEEKESKTFAALNASPLTRFEFIVGKSLIGSIISVIQIVLIYFIFGFSHVNFLQVIFISIMGLSIVLIMGFILGLVSPSQMAAIANMKLLLLPVSVTIVGAVLLPKENLFLLWWSPFYWVYDGMMHIIQETAQWKFLLLDAFMIIIITFLVFLIFRKKIVEGIESR